MKSLHRTIAISTLLLGLACTGAQATTIAGWTFETNVPTNSAGPYAAEVGSGSASGFHSGTTTYSAPVGNGSAHSFSSNGWNVGDYYQFSTSTLGYSGISLSWDQTGSGTGPRDFKLSYSTNGIQFSDFSSYSVLINNNPSDTPPGVGAWSSGTTHPQYGFTVDLSSISALDNQAALIYFRLVDTDSVSTNGGTVGSAGSDRVDNFIVSGTAIPQVPLPAAAWLFGSGLLGLTGLGRRRRAV